MAKQVSKTVIGGFVISGIVMLIAGVIILGSGAMFKKTQKYVMFFEKSVKGLSIGAPVVWLGVEIGSVSSIVLDADPETLSVNVPVIIEVDPTRMRVKGEITRDPSEQLGRLIDRGLRAQLTMQSFVTGQLMVEVDFYPDTPVRLTGLEPGYPEIPTMTSSMDQLADKIEKLPIDQIADKLLGIIGKVDKALGEADIVGLSRNLNMAGENLTRMIMDTNRLVNHADDHVRRISEGIQTALTEAEKLLKIASRDMQGVSADARKLLRNADGQIQPVGKKAQEGLVAARQASDQAKITLAAVDGIVGEGSDTRRKLNIFLDEIAAAARSLHSLMDYLERHPEALLKGKGGRGG